MKDLNPEYVRQVSTSVNGCPYFQLLSMKLVELEVGKSVLHIDLGKKHLQPFGVVHGGVFSSIIDAAAFWAVYSEAAEELGMTTVDLKINYLAPAYKGTMVAEGRCIKLGKTIGLGEARIMDDEGKMLAHGTSTLMILKQFPFQSTEPLPFKFLGT